MSVNEEGTYTIRASRLAELEEAERRLLALENMGVNNWDGYSEAMREFYADEDDL